MKAEDQVPSRETCERLKEKGFPQEETLFLWWTPPSGDGALYYRTFCSWKQYLCAAPTLAELLEALPDCHLFGQGKKVAGYLGLFKVLPNEYEAAYANSHQLCVERANYSNPAEAAALLWLKVKGEK